jgi:hypothetical protein
MVEWCLATVSLLAANIYLTDSLVLWMDINR